MTAIALVVLDTVRKDAFDEYFDWLPGKRFENAWSTSHWTTPAHASLFTGKYASEVGTHARALHFDDDGPILAKQLRDRGYRTRAFSANPHVSPHFGFDAGFDEFELNWHAKRHRYDVFPWSEYMDASPLPFPLSTVDAGARMLLGEYDTGFSLRSAIRGAKRRYPVLGGYDKGATEALEFVRSTEFGEDEFLFVNLMEAHTPYRPPKRFCRRSYTTEETTVGYRTAFRDATPDPERVRMAYADSVSYLSHAYRELFAALEEFDYVVTLSDHGELFGEHGAWEHWYGVYPELTRVPLVVTGPEGRTSRSDTYVNLIDVYETVLALADGDRGRDSAPLLGDESNRACLTEYHGITHEERFEALRERGVDEGTLSTLDEPKFGIGLAPTYYGFETSNGYENGGESATSDPRRVLDDLKPDDESLDRDREETTESMKEHLSDLGYM